MSKAGDVPTQQTLSLRFAAKPGGNTVNISSMIMLFRRDLMIMTFDQEVVCFRLG